MRTNRTTLGLIVAFLVSVSTLNAQFTLQSYSTNLGGGAISGSTLTGEIALGEVAGIPAGITYSSYLGLTSGNLETAQISVRTEDGSGNLISDDVNGYLLKVKPSGSYDTLEVQSGVSSDYAFSSVFTGSYLINVEGATNADSYIATYNGDVISWEDAQPIDLDADITVSINIEQVPSEFTAADGTGTISGTIQTEVVDQSGRVLQTSPYAGKKSGLRVNNNGTLKLVAITETDADGYFEFNNLPPNTYEFFIDVPGIPFDQAAATTIQLEEGEDSSDEFQIQAVITESGIQVSIQEIPKEVLGIDNEISVSIYPNPTLAMIHLSYDEYLPDHVEAILYDMDGRKLVSKQLNHHQKAGQDLDLSTFKKGVYLLKLYDVDKNEIVSAYKVIKQ